MCNTEADVRGSTKKLPFVLRKRKEFDDFYVNFRDNDISETKFSAIRRNKHFCFNNTVGGRFW
jgi:hypothetical protein